MTIKPWPKLSSRPAGDFRIFNIRSDIKRSPRTGHEHDFYVIECVDWVNVVALTPNRELVMIEQFRHGSESVELEVPGGMIDDEDASPVAGGLRELKEETGYVGRKARLIGKIYPNPAIMNNTCHTLLVEDCELRHDTALDHAEDLKTVLVPMDDIPGLIRSGKIMHSLVVVALFHFDLWRRDRED